ncbi:hypothetical protein GCM10010299_21920 [Streptomyces tanashiensis]|nr:hypothetical protein GCM10010299_21920 [Streptomyces tanashiensis]
MTSTIAAVLAGFGTGLSLIVAIGAQNAFVLRQGVRRHAVLAVVAICAVSDAVLIALGVAGVGAVVTAWPAMLTAVGLAGGAFLLCYGILAARRVLRPDPAATLSAGGPDAGSARRAVLTCLAMTWLNPHVYLDTVLLVGCSPPTGATCAGPSAPARPWPAWAGSSPSASAPACSRVSSPAPRPGGCWTVWSR